MGKTTPDKITPRQIKALWGGAARVHVPEGVLRDWVTTRTAKRSIRALTKVEASRLIGELLDVEAGLAEGLSTNRMTAAQVAWIRVHAEMMGWDERRVFGLSGKMYHGKGIRVLSRKEASGLIEALKAIGERTPKAKAA